MKNTFKNISYTGLVFLTAFIVIFIFGKPDPDTTAAPVQPQFTVAPEITSIATDLGINQQYLREAKAQFGNPETACNKAGARGCFNGVITISPSITPEEKKVALAHEYMHFVWSNKVVNKQAVSAEVLSFANQYRSNIAPRFEFYKGVDQKQLEDEYQAIFCTEIADWRLSPELKNYCTTWLPNRSALPSYF